MLMIMLDYTDSDGDSIVIFHDPLPNDPEDLWIEVSDGEIGRRIVVRIPRSKLLEGLV